MFIHINVETSSSSNAIVLAPSNVVMPIDTNVASSLQCKSATSTILDFANVITANDYREFELIEEAQNFTV